MFGDKFTNFFGLKSSKVNDTDDIRLKNIRQDGSSRSQKNEVFKNYQPNVIIKNISTLNQAFEDIRSLVNDDLTIHYKTSELLEKFDETNFKQIKQIIRNNQVIAIQSQLDGKFCIVWRKSEEEIYALNILKNNNIKQDDLNILCSFLLEFLSSCLVQNHSSLSDTSTDDFDIDLQSLTDTDGLNLLFHSALNRKNQIIPILLQVAFNVNMVHEDYLPVDYAHRNEHYDTVLLLLNHNSLYPYDINYEECPNDDLKAFIDTSSDLFWHILDCNSSSMDEDGNSEDIDGKNAQNLPEIHKILLENSHLRYFHDLKNLSALGTALYRKKYEVYELLLQNNMFLTLGESMDFIMTNFNNEEKEIVREIHFRNKKDMHEPHLLELLKKSSDGHNDRNVQERLNNVLRAFQVINKFPMIQIILKIAALLPNLQIIFDFNKDSVEYLDPTQNSLTSGLFYSNGRVYIGALQLINPLREHEVFATIAHELCHFVMFSIFGNKANPYKNEDEQTKVEFERISIECQLKKEIDEIISAVYDYYKPEMFHRELIVRIPHFYAHYHDQPEVIERLKVHFKSLFDFYESNLVQKLNEKLEELKIQAEKEIEEVKEMKEKIPQMETKIDLLEKTQEEKKKKMTRLRIAMIISSLFLITVSSIIIYFVYNPTYKWLNLDNDQKMKVFNGSVKFEGINAKFYELYGNNYTENGVFDKLKSDQIKLLLNDGILDLNEDQNKFLQNEILLKFNDLPENFQEKVQNSSIVLQGQPVVISSLLKNNTVKILETLNSTQIVDLIKDTKTLKIGQEIESSTNFYIEREFLVKSVEKSQEKLLSDLINKSENKKVILLSDDAGTGKSTTVKHLAMDLKKKFSLKWVQYIDFNVSIQTFEKFQEYEKNQEVKTYLPEILIEIFNLKGLNAEIFRILYNEQNVVILWDGFHETLIYFVEFMLSLLKNIERLTRNIQFISTETHHEQTIRKILDCSVYKFKPFTKANNKELLNKIYDSKNLSTSQVQKSKVKFQKLIAKAQENISFALKDRIASPLMFKMIAEASANDDDNSFDTTNLYTIYESFMKTKVNDLNQNIWKGMTLNEVFQYYAVKSFNYEFRIIRKYEKTTFDLDKLSNNGILIFDSKGKAKFYHRSFTEFYLAEYLIGNFYNFDNDTNCDEINEKFEILIEYTVSINQPNAREFLFGHFAKNYTVDVDQKLSFCFKTNRQMNRLFHETFLVSLNNDGYLTDFDKVIRLLEVFPFTSESLEVLWHTNKNEPFFCEIAIKHPKQLLKNYDKIQKLLNNYDQEKQQKFLFGQNQKGSVLYSLYTNIKKFNVYTNLQSLNTFLGFDLNKLSQFTVFEFYKFLKSSLTDEEIREMFKTHFVDILTKAGVNMWNEIESKFTREDLQKLIYESKLKNKPLLWYITDNNLITLIFKILDGSPDSQFLKFIQHKNFLLLKKESIILDDKFENIWNVIMNRTTEDEKKEILEMHLFNDMRINIFSASIELGTIEKFELMKNIYEQSFRSTEEKRKFCQNYFEIEREKNYQWHPNVETAQAFVEYLKTLFDFDEIKSKFKKSLEQLYEFYSARENLNFSYPFFSLLNELHTDKESEIFRLLEEISKASKYDLDSEDVLSLLIIPNSMNIKELRNISTFTEFFKLIQSHLTDNEVREYVKANFIKIILIGGVDMWTKMESEFERGELQELIYESTLEHVHLPFFVEDLTLLKWILKTINDTKDSKFVQFIQYKARKRHTFLLLRKDLIMADDNFQIIWNIIKNQTTKDERNKILELQLISNQFPQGFNIFSASIEYGRVGTFELVKSIYEQNFNSARKMREFCVNYFEIKRRSDYPWHPNVETTQAFVEYLKKLFDLDDIEIKFKESLEQLYWYYSERENLDFSYPFFSLLKELYH